MKPSNIEDRVEQLEREITELRHQLQRFGHILLQDEGKGRQTSGLAVPGAAEQEQGAYSQRQELGAAVPGAAHRGAAMQPQPGDSQQLSGDSPQAQVTKQGAASSLAPTTWQRLSGDSPQPQAPPAGSSVAPPRPPKQPPQPIDWEHLIGRVWLPRIFVIVLLVGVLWGFLAAVNAGYITPEIRCLLGLVAALVMFAAGVRWMRQKRNALGLVLLGGANGVLVLTLFAAHMLYDFIGAGMAFVLYVAAVVLFAGTALRYRSQALMLAAAVAGTLVPFLVDSSEPNITLLIVYEAMFAAVVLLISWRYAFRITFVASYALLQLPAIAAGIGASSDRERWLVLGALLLHHLLQYGLSLRDDSFASRPERQGLLFASFALNAAWLNDMLEQTEYRWALAALALFYTVTAYMLRSSVGQRVQLYAITATLGWLLLLINVVSDNYLGATLLIQGILALYLGLKLKSWMQQTAGAIIGFIGVALVLKSPIEEAWSGATLSWLVLLAGWTVLYFLLRPIRTKDFPQGPGPVVLWSGAILVLVFLTQLTLALAQSLEPDSRSLLLSAVWVTYAVVLIAVGMFWRQVKVRMAGIVLLLLTLLKVIFIDLPGVSTAVRAILFIGLGAIGILVSRFLYRKQKD
ncbi:Predicted membrane protein [Paenibacillaceae bacterium GAS479]|nr:Predicted membrane protein [Paenibacillaceae bacterium GAS479]